MRCDSSSGVSGTGPTSSADTDNDPSTTPETAASNLVDQATDPTTGDIDTACLAEHVASVAQRDIDAASVAYDAIENELVGRNPADVSRFNEDVVSVIGASVLGAGQGLVASGGKWLEQNPELVKRWESTHSAWTRKGGFTDNLKTLLAEHQIEVGRTVHSPPPGSLSRTSGVPRATAVNTNGALARDAIADRFRALGLDPVVEQDRFGGQRRVDVVVDVPNKDPRYAQRIEVESKSGRTGSNAVTRGQIEFDARALAENRSVRRTGEVLENVGKVARPVGVVLDAVALGQAYQADGNRVGAQTGRTASGVAGGALGAWGGAAGGAALGTLVFPGVGTVVGGIIGGIAGGIGGDAAGKGLFDTVKGWF